MKADSGRGSTTYARGNPTLKGFVGGLLPTLTVFGNTNRPYEGKNSGYGLRTALFELLPTLTAQSYGTNHGGAAGRVGPVRLSLETMARTGALPTLLSRDWKSSSPAKHSTKARPLSEVLPTLTSSMLSAQDLEQARFSGDDPRRPSYATASATPGPLNPIWCEWFMGFPLGWTILPGWRKPRSHGRSKKSLRSPAPPAMSQTGSIASPL